MLVMFQDLIMQGGDDDVVGHSLCRTVSCRQLETWSQKRKGFHQRGPDQLP